MNLKQFNQINSKYNRIPLVREVFADLDTPLSTYLKLADEPYSYLFESVQGGEKWGRYSIIGLACNKRLKVFGHHAILEVDGEIISEEEIDDPLQYIEDYLNFFKVAGQVTNIVDSKMYLIDNSGHLMCVAPVE